MAKRRFRKIRRRDREPRRESYRKPEEDSAPAPSVKKRGFLLGIYEKKYKALLIIPFLMLILALGQIAFQTITTGQFITRGVSLKGGTTITIPTQKAFDTTALDNQLRSMVPGADIDVRVLNTAGSQTAIVIETDLSTKTETDGFIAAVEKVTGISQDNYSVDVIGSSLGQSFFTQIMIALVIAFLFMGTVVFLYFRTFYPSAAVILAAFSDMAVTVAVSNIMGIKLSTAGVAAFLMLIGYSIDTDILLSTRLLKRKEGEVFDRLIDSAKTGLTMTFTTLAAVLVVLIFSKSEVLTQIMTILLIGLLVDIINTWIQNAGLLRLYFERNRN